MARKRMIDPNIWDSEDFSKLSVLARLLFIGMFSNADDEGRGKGRAIYLKSVVFPYDETMRISDIERTLDEIAENMSVVFYSEGGNEYYELLNFKKWQKVDKPRPSIIPPYQSSSAILRGTLAPKKTEEKLNELNPEKKEIIPRGEHQNVVLSGEDYEKLAAACGSKEKREEYIERLSGWLKQIGPKKASAYSSHYATITNWVRRDRENNPKAAGAANEPDGESLSRVKEYLRRKGRSAGKAEAAGTDAFGADGSDAK